MPAKPILPLEQRVLILMPTHKDAVTTAEIFKSHGIESLICSSIQQVCSSVVEGAGAAIITEEAIVTDRMNLLEKTLVGQPAWSDFPVIVLTPSGNDSPAALKMLEQGHMRFLKRPLHIVQLLSSVHTALRDRKRQYAVRAYLKEREIHASQLTEARDKAESANAAKSEFLATMSHEIRTPMNAIIGLSNILSISRPLTEKQKQFIDTLKLSADSLLLLINDLLDIAKIETQSVELEHIPFSLSQLIEDVIAMMTSQAAEKGIHFTTDTSSIRNQEFIGDPTRLRQILINLCGNALKFTDRGKIKLTAHTPSPMTSDTIDMYISVADTGTGIPKDKLASIFEKFMQADNSINRKFGGTGLGLAISKTLVELMNGRISVDSVEGEGSTFTVLIPLARHASSVTTISAAVVPPADDVHAARDVSPRILIVEDYQPNIMVVSCYLEEFGYDWDVAGNGLEAIEKSNGEKYAAILMDVQMHEMNGFQATQAIRDREKKLGKKRIPIIGMTAHALVGDKEKCLDSGMDDYLPKPFNPDELSRKLSSYTKKAAA